MSVPRLVAFGYRRHADFGISPAFKRTLVDPLKPYADVEIVEHGSLDWQEVARRQPLVFFDRRPPPEVLSMTDVRIVWIPMWDALTRKPHSWWKRWARYPVRIISFSRRLTRQVQKANIQVLDVHYYDDPAELPPVTWGSALNVFYWNRAGLLGEKHLIALCHALNIARLYYRPITDYYVPKSTQFCLPDRIGKTEVQTLYHLPHEEYLSVLSKTNLYVAPRWFEGIGLTVTEALASGCVVLANNAPTMNEYIINGKTGVFLPYNWPLRYLFRFKSKAEQRIGLDRPAPSPLVWYNWKNLLNYDLPQIGANARKASEEGRKRYMDSISPMLDFILDW